MSILIYFISSLIALYCKLLLLFMCVPYWNPSSSFYCHFYLCFTQLLFQALPTSLVEISSCVVVI